MTTAHTNRTTTTAARHHCTTLLRPARLLLAYLLVASALVTGIAATQNTPAAAALDEGRTPTPAVAAGASHTCSLSSRGDVTCWGYNFDGQLGNGTTTNSTTPVTVDFPTGTVGTTVTAGDFHTCAILNTGTTTCWGSNDNGQLGNGSNTDSATPVTVDLPVGATATTITAGSFHTCAILNTGTTTCWGNDFYGQLGNGSNTDSTTPVTVDLPVGTTATTITAGPYHTCAILNTGTTTCWGSNDNGQLGNGSNTDSATPVTVDFPTGTTAATAITAGAAHTCAILNTGEVSCWGRNFSGQLGNGTTTNSTTPVTVTLPVGTTATTITAGDLHTCAILNTGQVSCWGRNVVGQLGNGTTTDSTTPVTVDLPTGTTATTITAGDLHTCAILNTGTTTCWGNNFYGQLGNGTTTDSAIPVLVGAPGAPTDPAATGYDITADSAIITWTAGPASGFGATTGYRVEQSTDNGTTWTAAATQWDNTVSTDENARVTGLTNGTPVEFRVIAINAVGNSAPSASTAPFIPTPQPTVVVTPTVGQGNPTNIDPVTFTATFSQPVTGFDAEDLDIENFAPAGATAVVTPDPANAAIYTITVSGMTADGDITITVPQEAVVNTNGQENAESNTSTVTYDTTGPVATIDLAAGQTSPTTATPAMFTVAFDQAVTGFDTTDYTIAGTAGATTSTLTTNAAGDTYTISVDTIPNAGTITVSVNAGAVTDAAGNASTNVITASTIEFQTVADAPTGPSAGAGNTEATISWTTPSNTGGTTLTGYTVEQSTDGGTTWTTATTAVDTNTSTATTAAVTGLTNGVPVEFRVFAINAVGDSAPSASTGQVTPTTAPTVAIAATAGQGDPTSTDPVTFTATFSQPVTGFDAADVLLTAPTGAAATVTAVSASEYTITVSAMTADGTITVTIPANAAVNANNQPTAASNTPNITYDTTGPVATINLATSQNATTTATPVAFTITFDEAVTDFETTDIVLSGTANPTGLTLTGTGSIYTATIDQAANAGTITISVPAGAATDLLGNASTTMITADTVTITDVNAPVINTPTTNIEVNTDPGQPFATVSYTVTATDPDSNRTTTGNAALINTDGGLAAAFGGAITPDCTPASGSQFPIGTTTVNCSASDSDNNTATAAFAVVVTDNEDPIITGATDQTITLAAWHSGPVIYAAPTATDNSGTATIDCTPVSGSTLTAGTTNITCTATDPANNTATAAFTLTINAAPTPPMTELPATGGTPPWKPALALIALGALALLVARQRRLTVTIR